MISFGSPIKTTIFVSLFRETSTLSSLNIKDVISLVSKYKPNPVSVKKNGFGAYVLSFWKQNCS